ncbi:MAG: ThuA domain-containing protein [Armatimonadetes bacterium]|nr:ThuA domain-containing protein [Armatimonadota bacterium]
MPCQDRSDKITVALVTGGHPFDVPSVHRAFRSIPDVDFYPQHMEDFATDVAGVRDDYDAVVFYDMHQATPTGQGPWQERKTKEALERIGTTPQGIIILHHAILAFPQWDFWSELVGIRDRRISAYYHDQQIRVEVADRGHPITRGLASWEMIDETYVMAEPGEGSHVLLTVNHPNSMRTVGWARQFGQARVFCLQLGHGASAFGNANFREILARGLRWVAGRVD